MLKSFYFTRNNKKQQSELQKEREVIKDWLSKLQPRYWLTNWPCVSGGNPIVLVQEEVFQWLKGWQFKFRFIRVRPLVLGQDHPSTFCSQSCYVCGNNCQFISKPPLHIKDLQNNQLPVTQLSPNPTANSLLQSIQTLFSALFFCRCCDKSSNQ